MYQTPHVYLSLMINYLLFFLVFTSQLSYVEIPKNVQEALQVLEWRKAIKVEMWALENNQTREVMNLPKQKKTVESKWVSTIKYNSNGTLEGTKLGWWLKGLLQTKGID